MINDFLFQLEAEYKRNGNNDIAVQQKAYMRNQFEFFGLKAPTRREISKPFLIKNNLPPKEQLHEIIIVLWQKPEREFQLFGQELVFKYVKQFENSDFALFEYMITEKSWWDSVDFIAANILGAYFKKFPEDISKYVDKWLDSGNIWLQRSALLFQLKYKSDLDTEILHYGIKQLSESKEFFINKAIGWVLREYSKTNPVWVKNYVESYQLHPLSTREALRLMN